MYARVVLIVKRVSLYREAPKFFYKNFYREFQSGKLIFERNLIFTVAFELEFELVYNGIDLLKQSSIFQAKGTAIISLSVSLTSWHCNVITLHNAM